MSTTSFFAKLSPLRTFLDKVALNNPKIYYIFLRLSNLRLNKGPEINKFSNYFEENFWGSDESVSGPGSVLNQTAEIREKIPILIKEFNIKSILDIPCGDFNWMSRIHLKIDKYIGADIVPDLVKKNSIKFKANNLSFRVLDVCESKFPKVDLILCRDCFVHLSYSKIFSSLKNCKNSQSKYLLTSTFPAQRKNRNIYTGGWRPLNFEIKPFNFPSPIKIINEKCTETRGKFSDKSLGLWKIKDLP